MTPSVSASGRLLYILLLLFNIFVFLSGLAGLCVALAPYLAPESVLATMHANSISNGIGGLRFHGTTPVHDVMVALWTLLRSWVIALISVPLMQLVKSANRGAPFTKNNLLHLRLITLGCVLMTFAPFLGALVIGSLVQAPPRDTLDTRGEFNWLFFAMIVAVLTSVFHEGVRLREDADSTV